MKALIGYGTWYGATSDTSERIAEVLREKEIDVNVVDLGEETVDDVSEYDLIVVGAGVRMARWNRSAEKFIDKHKKDLADKKVALFVSAGGASIDAKNGETEKVENAYEKHLVKKAEKYSLDPISMSLFGGLWDYNQMGWLTRKLLGRVKKSLHEAGFEEENGVYDTRNFEEIRDWAVELAEKVKE